MLHYYTGLSQKGERQPAKLVGLFLSRTLKKQILLFLSIDNNEAKLFCLLFSHPQLSPSAQRVQEVWFCRVYKYAGNCLFGNQRNLNKRCLTLVNLHKLLESKGTEFLPKPCLGN